jgi:threonine dehydrogenase-like Zn-dependent dehydrogenase
MSICCTFPTMFRMRRVGILLLSTLKYLTPIALYLSDVLSTSYNAVKDTAVYPNDQVAIFGAGPIGQMAGIFALREGASKVIFVDTEPRLSFVANRWPSHQRKKLVLLDFQKLSYGVTSKDTVVSKLKELCDGRGPDAAIECAAGEYAKGWLHWLEIHLGTETDTSEILNEMIESVRNYGRCGITGVYVGYVRTIYYYVPSTTRHVVVVRDSFRLTFATDQPLRHWLSDAARCSPDRKWPGSGAQVLGGAPADDSEGRSGSAADGLAPRQAGRS